MGWSRRLDVLCENVGDEVVLYDNHNNSLHVLNPTAYFIWQQLDGKSSPAAIANLVREEFSVDSKTDVMEGVLGVVALFGKEGLLIAK